MTQKDWHSPGEIRYTREEMIWGIQWLSFLEVGEWPPDYKETGYTGSKGGRSTKTKFLPAALFFAEITARLKSTKEAGEALVDEIQSGITDYEGLSRPAKRALNYISGWRRRRQTYSQWKKYNKNSTKRGEKWVRK